MYFVTKNLATPGHIYKALSCQVSDAVFIEVGDAGYGNKCCPVWGKIDRQLNPDYQPCPPCHSVIIQHFWGYFFPTLVVISARYFSRVNHHDEVAVDKLIHGQFSVSILVEAVKDVFRSRLGTLLAHLLAENNYFLLWMKALK